MIVVHVLPGVMMLVCATGIMAQPIHTGTIQDKPPPTSIPITMDMSPGMRMPNFKQVPGNLTDILNMLENNGAPPDMRSNIVADILHTLQPSEDEPKRGAAKTHGKPFTITFESVPKETKETQKMMQSPQNTPAQKGAIPQSDRQKNNSPSSGYEEEEEYHTEEKHAKEEEKIISIPISLPVNMATNVQDLLPKLEESKKVPKLSATGLQPVPLPAKATAAKKALCEHKQEAGEDKPVRNNPISRNEELGAFDEIKRGTELQGLQSSDTPAPRRGKLIAIPLSDPSILADILNGLDGKPDEPTREPTKAVQDESTQTESNIPSLPPPNPALLGDLLQDILSKLKSTNFSPEDNSTEKENKVVPVPSNVMDITNAFQSIFDNARQGMESQSGNKPTVSSEPLQKAANVVVPILKSLTSGLMGSRPETVAPAGEEEERVPLFEPAKIMSSLLGSEPRLGQPMRETKTSEKEDEFTLETLEERKILEIMYVKHLTFKLQLHMKVWHMFFSYISRDPEAANDCTVILKVVSKFYKQLTIDVEVVQKFRVLYRVVRMMTHNEKNLKTFFEKTAKQPPKIDVEKVKQMKDAQNIEKWQNEIVASLWKNAMSHFDDQLEHVENFFKNILNNNESVPSVRDSSLEAPTECVKCSRGQKASKFEGKPSIVDIEVTKIHMRKKIFRTPNQIHNE